MKEREVIPTKESFLKELEVIERMNFPVKAMFIEEEVTVLGPIHRFEPYKEMGKDNFQLLCKKTNGKKFITFALYLEVEGQVLATPPKPKGKSQFQKLLENQIKR